MYIKIRKYNVLCGSGIPCPRWQELRFCWELWEDSELLGESKLYENRIDCFEAINKIFPNLTIKETNK